MGFNSGFKGLMHGNLRIGKLQDKEAYVAVVSHCEQGFHVGFTLIEVGRLVGRKRLASKAH